MNFCLMVLMMSGLQIASVTVVSFIIRDVKYEQVVMLSVYILMIVLYMVIRKIVPLERVAAYFQRRDVIMNCVFIVCVGAIFLALMTAKSQGGMHYGDYVVVSILIVMVIALAISWIKYKEKALQAEAQVQAYKAYSETFEKLLLDIRLKQHDFNNHINAIYSQHYMYDNYEELVECQKQYCANLLEDNKYYSLLRLDSSVVAGFLYGKFLEAEEKGIEVSYDIKVNTMIMEIPEYKLVDLFGNLINNAFDALEDQANKRLYVGVKEYQKQYKIVVSNIGDIIEPEQLRRMFKKNYSSKGADRGLGLYILKRMSKEYGYTIECSNEMEDDINWVRFTIMINKKDEESSENRE